MADMEAEMAFLNSMQAMNEAAGNYQAVDLIDADQPKSVSIEDNHHVQPVKGPSSTAHADDSGNAFPVLSSSALSPSETTQAEPMAHVRAAMLAGPKSQSPPTTSSVDLHVPSPPSSTESSSKVPESTMPRTVAGFIVNDDEEDDEAEYTPTLAGEGGLISGSPLSGSDGVSALLPAPPKSPSDILTSAQDVPLPNVAPTNASELPSLNSNDDSANSARISVYDVALSADGIAQPPQPYPDTGQLTDSVPATNGTIKSPTVPGKARLPHDRVGILEDRIKDDPRGDLDAWLSLINEHRKRNKLQDARLVYERFFKIFPTAAEQWVAYANMELAHNDFYRVEQIFNKSLLTIPNVQLWSLYLDYVRRRNNLTTDAAGTARTIISQAYDFVLQNVGVDKDSGRIWQDYVQFLRSGPGTIGGSSWQDQQKMDQLRKAYQRAICIPTSAVNGLWKEYDAFEMGLNKMTGRKFLQERSPAYMTARSSNTELENLTQGLRRTTLPRLPPALGFDGDDEYLRQVELWNRWIRWEKNDPLVLKDDDVAGYRARIVYVYKQAVMALRFWPEVWFDASEFCHQNGLDKEGNDFLSQGIVANPESCLLAFKRADRLEITLPVDESEEGVRRRGASVREPYDKLLDALYDLIAKVKAREAQDVLRIEERFTAQGSDPGERDRKSLDDEDEAEAESDAREAAKKAQIKIVQEGSGGQIRLLSRTISFAWISLMRAMRRMQGKGKVNDAIGGSRQVFTDARKRGRLTSDVYVASALIEYHCYKDPAATKIFERGMKLFPEDETFALEYLKHLIAINDITNARAVFETTVSRLGQKPELLSKAKPIYAFFHEYESCYGELSQINKLEKRMADLFPEDPKLSQFGHRFASNGFDPTAVRPIISPATQTRSKSLPSVEPAPTAQNTPPRRLVDMQHAYSPKRHLPADESDHEVNRPRKLARGESPLKGAAGRRVDQQKRTQQQHQAQGGQGYGSVHHPPPPPPLPRDVLFLLSIIPRAETYYPATRFSPQEMVRLLKDTPLPAQSYAQLRPPPATMPQAYSQGEVD